jgi:hypothetical protein
MKLTQRNLLVLVAVIAGGAFAYALYQRRKRETVEGQAAGGIVAATGLGYLPWLNV